MTDLPAAGWFLPRDKAFDESVHRSRRAVIVLPPTTLLSANPS